MSFTFTTQAERIGRLQLNEKFEDGTDIPIMSYNEEANISGPILNLVDFSIPGISHTLQLNASVDVIVLSAHLTFMHFDLRVPVTTPHFCQDYK